jgi:hypothetical protein
MILLTMEYHSSLVQKWNFLDMGTSRLIKFYVNVADEEEK